MAVPGSAITLPALPLRPCPDIAQSFSRITWTHETGILSLRSSEYSLYGVATDQSGLIVGGGYVDVVDGIFEPFSARLRLDWDELATPFVVESYSKFAATTVALGAFGNGGIAMLEGDSFRRVAVPGIIAARSIWSDGNDTFLLGNDKNDYVVEHQHGGQDWKTELSDPIWQTRLVEEWLWGRDSKGYVYLLLGAVDDTGGRLLRTLGDGDWTPVADFFAKSQFFALREGGGSLYAVGTDGAIGMYDLTTGATSVEEAPDATMSDLAVLSNGDLLSVGHDGRACIRTASGWSCEGIADFPLWAVAARCSEVFAVGDVMTVVRGNFDSR